MEQLTVKPKHINDLIAQTVEKVWLKSDSETYLQNLVEGLDYLSHQIVEAGDFSAQQLEVIDEEQLEILPHFVIHFLWAEQAKRFLVLWRDVVFQQQKAQVLWQDGQIEGTDLEKLRLASKETIGQAFEELQTYFEQKLQSLQSSKTGGNQQLETWRLQANPWKIYRTQFQEFPKQGHNLLQQVKDLGQLTEQFREVHSFVDKTMIVCEKEFRLVEETIYKLTEFVAQNTTEKVTKVVRFVEDVESKIEFVEFHKDFNNESNQLIESMTEKLRVYVHTNGGILQYKDINFRKQAKQWLDTEIVPMLYEVWELSSEVQNGLKMTLANIRNRAMLLSKEQKEGKMLNPSEIEDIGQPLTILLKKTTQWHEELNKLRNQVHERLHDTFRISMLFRNDDFLPISLQSTINQLRINQNEWFTKAQKWWQRQIGHIRQFKTSIIREQSLSISEKIVRCVQSRKIKPDNEHYANIFLTKGYIGEFFWVGRKIELQHIATLIQQWKNGYRGAVLLRGQRFSGKSLFGELVANQYFLDNQIRLQPNTTVVWKGRKFKVEEDLGAILEQIKHYALHVFPLVWIDDLELWNSTTISLSQNVQSLLKYIDAGSKKMFFMVSMSNWLKAHLQQVYELDRVFQAEIHLSTMKAEDISRAIMIRHGATHKALINEEGNEATPQQFKKMTHAIYKTSNGNIGDALNQWSFATRKIDEDRVQYDSPSNYSLPDFLHSDTSILLTTIMMEKRTNEYHLRRIFGPAFNKKYKNILQRLLSIGILTRHLDGQLEVNTSVVNEIGALLEEKTYIKFDYQ